MQRHLLALILLAVQAPALQANENPRSFVSEEQVRSAARNQFEEVNRRESPALDQAFSRRATCIAKALVTAIPSDRVDPRVNWSVHVYEATEANAYALPSGHIVINSGLAKVAANSDELASAIATPIAMVILKLAHKKVSRRVQAQIKAMPFGLSPTKHAEFDMQEAQIANAETLEADNLGRSIIKDAGFNPQAQLALLESLAASRPLLLKEYSPRIMAARTWLDQNPAREESSSKPCMLVQ